MPVIDGRSILHQYSVVGKIIQGHDTAGLFNLPNGVFRNATSVERIPSLVGNLLQRVGKLFAVDSVTETEKSSVGGIRFAPVGIVQHKCLVDEVCRQVLRNGETIPSKFDGRCKQPGPWERPVTLV